MTMQFNDYILITLLIISIFFDLTQKKIPNFITFPVMILVLISYIVTGGLTGFLFSISGLLLGIGLFLIPFMMGGMGGGDVKLLGAVGALKGAEFVFIATIYTALCGGVIAVIYLAIKGQLIKTLKNIIGIIAKPFFAFLALRFRNPLISKISLFFSPPVQQQEEKSLRLPYGIAIGLGTLIALSHLGQSLLPVSEMFFKK